MTPKEELEDLRQRYEEEVEYSNRRNTRRAIMFAAISLVTLISLVYAFFQQTAATKARMLAEEQTAELMACKIRAEKAEQIVVKLDEEARLSRLMAEEVRAELETLKTKSKK